MAQVINKQGQYVIFNKRKWEKEYGKTVIVEITVTIYKWILMTLMSGKTRLGNYLPEKQGGMCRAEEMQARGGRKRICQRRGNWSPEGEKNKTTRKHLSNRGAQPE